MKEDAEDFEETPSRRSAMLLAIYSLLVALRDPWLLLHGRVWAEEGPVYLRSAWSGPVRSALFATHVGYLSLWPNFIALLTARLVPLQLAAMVMTWCAFFIQIFAGYIVIQCEFLRTTKAKAIALALLLVTVGFESWLNTINSQFYLVICGAIILLSRPDRLKFLRGATLALAALTGPLTSSLTPFFWLRAAIVRTKATFVQAAIMTGCALIQTTAVLKSLHAGARKIDFQPSGIAPIFLVRYILEPITGRLGKTLGYIMVLDNNITHLLPAAHIHQFPRTWPFFLVWGMIDVAFIVWLFFITSDRSDRSSWWLLTMALWLALLCMYGSTGGTYGLDERYVFPSAFLIGLSLFLAALKRSTTAPRRISAWILVGCLLLAGTADFCAYPFWAAREKAGEPTWQSQANAWRQDPNTRLPVWPKGWLPGGFSLPPNHQ